MVGGESASTYPGLLQKFERGCNVRLDLDVEVHPKLGVTSRCLPETFKQQSGSADFLPATQGPLHLA